MTSISPDAAAGLPRAAAGRRPRVAGPVRLLGAIAQLALLGVVGIGLLGALLGALAASVVTVPLLGVGVLGLIAVVYVLFGLGWFEVARVDGLYGLGLPSLAPQRRLRPGFGGVLHTIARQAIDARMWRAIASFTVASILGAIELALFSGIATGVVFAFAPLSSEGRATVSGPLGEAFPTEWATLAGVGIAVVCLALVAVTGVLHGIIARAIVGADAARLAADRARSQREGAVRAADVERSRIERDLHDGVQPRLVSIGMTLGLAQRRIDEDPAAAKELVAEAHESIKAVITELRQLARGIHTAVLDDRGLDAALSALAARSHLPVHLDVRLDGRCSRDAEAALYFTIAEGITNAAKHAGASECRVAVRRRDDGSLWARIDDDGTGGARVIPGGGIDGIANRVLAAGGAFRLDSPAGGPTTLEASVPCAS